MAKWSEAQTWEADWWGDCLNTHGEEEKQLLYAKFMGLRMFHNRKSPYNIDLERRNVVDIGGGPASLLLKCVNRGDRCTVVDPLVVPEWVRARYDHADIEVLSIPGEDLRIPQTSWQWDEAWIYNCLQHTEDPKLVVANALEAADIVRVFEWVDTRINEGHPHAFSAQVLDEMLGGEGKTIVLKGQANCFGKAYYGIFVGTGLD